MKLLAKRVETIEKALIGSQVEVSDDEYAALVLPVIEALAERRPLPCDEATGQAVLLRWMDECAKAPPIVMRPMVD